MAASWTQAAAGATRYTLAFTLLLIASLLNAGVAAQDATTQPGVTTTGLTTPTEGNGGTSPGNEAHEPKDSQMVVFPTITAPSETAEETTAASPTATGEGGDQNTEQVTVTVQAKEAEAPAPPPPGKGDGPNNMRPPQEDVVCVGKEAVKDKNAVSLKLKAPSTCRDTKERIESVLKTLCGEDCKLEIYQEDVSDQIIVSGKYVEEDVAGMVEKFNNDNIKNKINVQEVVQRRGRSSKLVLVSLLLTGLLLAALLLAGYYLKTHRRTSKGVRLAESFQVDEENQANTLVSVAPLPQEPQNKPTANGESAAENGTTTPAANGHSATPQTPVADTEM